MPICVNPDAQLFLNARSPVWRYSSHRHEITLFDFCMAFPVLQNSFTPCIYTITCPFLSYCHVLFWHCSGSRYSLYSFVHEWAQQTCGSLHPLLHGLHVSKLLWRCECVHCFQPARGDEMLFDVEHRSVNTWTLTFT